MGSLTNRIVIETRSRRLNSLRLVLLAAAALLALGLAYVIVRPLGRSWFPVASTPSSVRGTARTPDSSGGIGDRLPSLPSVPVSSTPQHRPKVSHEHLAELSDAALRNMHSRMGTLSRERLIAGLQTEQRIRQDADVMAADNMKLTLDQKRSIADIVDRSYSRRRAVYEAMGPSQHRSADQVKIDESTFGQALLKEDDELEEALGTRYTEFRMAEFRAMTELRRVQRAFKKMSDTPKDRRTGEAATDGDAALQPPVENEQSKSQP